ncbi:MAG: hypothetical protein PHT69_05930 [Bacteroidales bacterium]|nr:hypothetical protein [Bacteroidales bacterium]
MKKIILLLTVLSAVSLLKAQNTSREVFSSEELVWYGLDFSKAKLIGQFDQAVGVAPATGNDIKSQYIPAWNNLIVSEPNKYDLRKTFKKAVVYNDLGVVERSNSSVNEDFIISYNEYSFENPAAIVENIVSGYTNGEKQEGIGLVFIVETFHKANQEATVYVTFFDIATKNILFSEKMVGKARGIGLRNYWAGAIYNILVAIQKTKFKAWEKTYGV